ncbi:MAG: hypothetical protein LBG18_08540 [Mediterranea sp.]|jgi:hypothetical protein|nr:hypothetical protein [Mediterranea sp.]
MKANNTIRTLSPPALRYHFFFVLSVSSLLLLICGCKEEDNLPQDPPDQAKNEIVITDIANIPPDMTFDRIKVDIKGVRWKIIASVEAPYERGKVVLTLPADFSPDDLQPVERTKENMYGYWPAISSDPDALVASLGDFIAYDGDVKVGRVYLTDWQGKGFSSAGKAYIYYHYADRPFTVDGQNLNLYGSVMFMPSYTYSLQFEAGWNIYANIKPANSGGLPVSCTTTLPDETQLHWRFE